MTTLFRLLKFVRCLNASSPKTRGTTVNFENTFADTLLNPQAVFLRNGSHNNYVSATDANPKVNFHDMDIEQKMTLLNKRINVYGRITKLNIEDILDDIQKSETVSSLQGLFLLRCCTELITDKSPALRVQLGEDIWRTLKKFGVKLDVSHYNTLLSIYLENECDFSPLQFLEEMLNVNVNPNRVTYQRLIEQFANQGKMTEANQLMEHMKIHQIPVNEQILCSFIWGHAINNNMEAAYNILKDMESLKITPTIQTYSTLMYAFARNGDIDSIRKVLADCKDKDIWIPDKVYLKIIYHFSLNGFTELVDEILSMTTKGSLYVKDANQIMYKLVEKQQDSIAFKIFQTLPVSAMNQSYATGDFFIQTLIDYEAPVEKSVEYCRYMVEKGMNHRSFYSAINKSLATDMYDSSFTFMKAWQDLGGQIRENYFYPIFKTYGEMGELEVIKKVIEKMILEFNIHPSLYALKSHILPYMQKSPDDVLTSLIDIQVDFHVAVNAIAMHLLSENRIREACKFMNSYVIQYRMGMLKYHLLQAFKKTEDAPSFVSILHIIYVSTLQKNPAHSIIDNKYLVQQFIDSSITEAIDMISPNNQYLLLMFFRNLVYKGVSISPNIATEVENKLNGYLVNEVKIALNRMKSGELVPKPILTNLSIPRRKYTDIEKLESMTKIITVTNHAVAIRLKRSLLMSYCNTLNEQKVEEILEDFKMNNVTMNILLYVQLINMYLNLQKPDKAEFWLLNCKKNYSSFRLHQDANLKFVTALIESGQIEKAQEYLTWPTWKTKQETLHDCRKLLDAVSKLNDAELLHKFFDLLEKNRYITNIRTSLFNSLIEFHLHRNDPATALQKFEWVHDNYKKLPCSIKLMKIFIKNHDNDSLERVKTACENLFGKIETNFYVAMAYLENNDLKTAKHIIQNDCAEVYENNVIHFADNYYKNYEIDNLERLFEILNTLKFDVEKLCVLLLKSYGIQKEWKKGYNLWMRMQKDDIQPSNTFMNCLNWILKEKNILSNDALQKFNTDIRNNDLATAKESIKSLPLVYKSDCYSLLCQKYMTNNDMNQTIDLWQELTQKWNLELDSNLAESILIELVRTKDIDSLERIGLFLSTAHKNRLKYSYYLNRAYLKTGSWNIYLKKLETILEDDPKEFNSLHFHNKTVVTSLMNYPELIQQFEGLAHKCNEKNIRAPVQTLWIYYFLNKDTKADELWTKYIKNEVSNVWLEVLDFSQCRNADAYLKVADLLRESCIKKRIKLKAYTKILRGCMRLDDPKKYEHGLRCLEHAMQVSCMNDFNINLLADLQVGLENSGIPWPWTAKLSNIDNEVKKAILNELL